MQTALAPLTLGPQPPEPDFQLADFGEGFGVQLARSRAAVAADGAGHFLFPDEGFLAAHARLRLFGELHQPAEGGCRDGDGARVFAREELAGFLLAEDGVEDPAEGFRELVVEVVFRVDGDVVLEHEDGIFAPLVVLGAAGTLDDDVSDAVAEGGSGAGVSLFHAVGELDVGLFVGVVGFGEGFGDDEFGHVDFVLEEVGDGVFDVAGKGDDIISMVERGRDQMRYILLCALDILVDQDLVENRFNDILNQTAIVSAYSLNALAVHLVELLRGCPVQSSVALLVDE